ncbi:MAG: nuclear transport factor 2 family protein [Gammaproteobacteria bacterium]|jgi:ketosteroid isomerase-like protein|nr:nuclear transport factor 2 family protein [Gammaproteobacteria bacterium]MDP6617480.1 nuclear transport factor 2 family protein [Gammaproteobacteria bacterium]MDP6695649.1 nuclear transport factor 2 family protein [Gammaproteobacteria bacterium]
MQQQTDDIDDPQLTSEIEALLRETEAAWNSQDYYRWLALWDADDARPFYLAAEEKDFFRRREQLEKYLDPEGATQVTEAIRVTFSDVSTRWLADDIAYAAYHMSSEMKLVFAPKPFISKLRATSVLRRKPEGWRYICYAEGFQSPTMYFQSLIENAVPDDYADFYRDVTGKEGF